MAKYVQTVKKPDGRVYYYSRIPTAHGYIKVRLPDNYDAAQLAALVLREKTTGYFENFARTTDCVRNDLCDYASSLIYMARERADKQGVPFSLTKTDIAEMVRKQDYRCCVTGIPFTMKSVGDDNFSRAFAPSIDRIVPSNGYVPDNVRIVCRIVNFAASKWGIGPVMTMAKAMCKKKRHGTELANALMWMETVESLQTSRH